MTLPLPSAEGRRYEAAFKRAVAEEIAELQSRGLSPIQGRDGYLVALQPDGQVRRLFKLRAPRRPDDAAPAVAGRP